MLMTRLMHETTQALDGQRVQIRPRYSFKRTEIGPGQFEVEDLQQPNTTASFRQWHTNQVAQDIKETICRLSEHPFNAANHSTMPGVTYELPDGQEISVGTDRLNVPELLFQPHLLASYKGAAVKILDGSPLVGLPDAVFQSVNKCDVDLRRELLGGVVLSGGTSLLPNLRERLERQLSDLAGSTNRVKVTAPANSLERRFSVWLGGSILASLGTFQQMWMSKQEYHEHGASLMQRRAP